MVNRPKKGSQTNGLTTSVL